jgi:phenylalanyl-tRNA synthetase beta chain
MKIAYNWLKQFIKIDWEADKVAELLTNLGLEVEGIEKYESVKGGLQGVIVGHVLTCKKHPNADRLNLAVVDLGNNNSVQIVCGASNIAAGQKIPVATIGTVLYDEKKEPWEIKKGKIRGEESYGMICSEAELGLGKNSDGILVLPDNAVPGTPCAKIFSIESDIVFEIGLTPNRADAMSHFGVARDLRAGLLRQHINTPLITPSVSSFQVANKTLKIDVEIQDEERCLRYCGLTMSGLKISESPSWLKNRLIAIGLTPKNNVVDATNYVLHELGQPLHAFDASKIAGRKIVVKTIKNGTIFTTLDGITRELREEDLMICDTEKPICIAGVFGGLHSGITEKTTAIFLESAYFSPVTIRRTAKRLGLNTDASFRFERGIDINITKYAMLRAALLIQEIAGGLVTSAIVDVYPKKIEDFQVFLSFENVTKLIGQEIPKEDIKQIISSLEIKINNVTETGMGLTVPSYRVDVRREADIIEEILRIYGYNTIHFTDKLTISVSKTSKFEDYKMQHKIGEQLVSQGFYEIMTNSLTTTNHDKFLETFTTERSVTLLNPLSHDLAQMRTSVLFSGLEVVAHNLNRKQEAIKFFEFAKTYHHQNNTYIENKHLSLFSAGDQTPENWKKPSQKSDFFYIKGIVTAILERLGITSLKTSVIENDVFAEGIALSAEKTLLVDVGLVKQAILKYFDIKQEVFFADFNWDAILASIKSNAVILKEIPKFPDVRRDLSLLIDNHITFEAIYAIAKQHSYTLIKNINLFDVYEGEHLPEDKKSYAIRFVLQNEEKTLTDTEIDVFMNQLQKRFEEELGAELRS